MIFEGILSVVLIVLFLYVYEAYRKHKRLTYIELCTFRSAISRKVKMKYPHLTDAQLLLVFEGLRDYFYICNQAKRRMVAMPSQVVDVAWHEFILFTRLYEEFCKKSQGRFLHHTPSEAMSSTTIAQQGIKRAWRLACAKENINPKTPRALPLLFAIDAILNIEDGFKYELNCKNKSSAIYGDSYCAGHIACSSGCAGGSGGISDSGSFSDGESGDSGGCGGGCGGS